MAGILEIWVGAFCTLAIFSFLYKDNPVFRFAESIFAGVSLGYYVGLTFGQTFMPNLIQPLFAPAEGVSRNWILLIPMFLGIILYTRYIPKIAWVSRFALAIYVGYYTGIDFMQRLQGEVLPQSADTIVSLASGWDMGVIAGLSTLVMVIGVISVLVYFFFSAEHKGVLGGVSRLGIWFLMVSFGAAFGYTIMGRISILIGRVVFLLGEWLKIG
ncbi:MAG: hypothetical protein QGG80_00845 [Candidatus Krumholzibacteria bacterium]|nr:hypothetical protein [Candidatus Krumholzibacteria bacterium]MDP6797270.1 hypothetical protein [Candidatus Krumholzibacteria bacterium]